MKAQHVREWKTQSDFLIHNPAAAAAVRCVSIGWRSPFPADPNCCLWLMFTSPVRRSFSHFARRRQQVFDYFLVLDFEATCDVPQKKILNEIIEFPVLLVDGQSLEELDRFHEFVRPRIYPILSDFCVNLTGIQQETVDAAQTLPHVWAKFTTWLKKHELIGSSQAHELVSKANFAFVTCGNWDLAVALRDDLRRHQLQQPNYMRNWINVKKSYCLVTGNWPSAGLSQMLSTLEVHPVGRAHSGIDDCCNTLLLMRKLVERGHVFSINS